MYEIKIVPQPCPRPRVTRNRVYYPNNYSEYKSALIDHIIALNIPKNDYTLLIAEFGHPYPKSTSKKRLIEGLPMRDKYDCDNAVKPLMDALEQAEVLLDDRQIYELRVRKVRTTTSGYIRFILSE